MMMTVIIIIIVVRLFIYFISFSHLFVIKIVVI